MRAKKTKVKKTITPMGESLMYEADGTTLRGDSYSAIQSRVDSAINAAIQAGKDMDLDGDNDANCGCYVWIMDLFPNSVIYSMGGDMFQCDYTDDGETVTLGTPVEVEASYSVVADENAADAREESQESHRAICADVSQLQEAAYDASSGTLTLTVIKPGFNKSKERYYPADVLKRDHKIFEGAKMFADHQSDKESRERPEGSVHNWVASIKKIWAESDGTVKANADVIDPPFKAKLEELAKKNLLQEMGVSIRAVGEAVVGKIEGIKTNIVESLQRGRSVDFVTYAGAGGLVEAIEAESFDNDVDLVSEAELRQRRPDLVELIESKSNSGEQSMKTLEAQLNEAKAAQATAEQKATKLQETVTSQSTQITTLTTKLEESELATKKANAQTELAKQLQESKLPELAKNKILAKFKEAVSVDGMKEAIEEERTYIKAVGGTSKVTNMGERHNSGELTESDRIKNRVELLMRNGMSEKDAKVAARGRGATA